MPGDYSEELARLLYSRTWGWTPTDEEWNALPATEREHAEGDARAVLDALSSSGRLVPEGSEVREEFGVELAHHSGHGTWDNGSAIVEVYEQQADADELTAYMASVATERPVRTIRRIAAYGPWTPSEPAQEER